MKKNLSLEEIRELAARFAPDGEVDMPKPFGGGHINDTYRFHISGGKQYVLQRINKNVFPDPMAVMDNVLRVTHHLRKHIRARGGDPERETLRMIHAADGGICVTDRNGDYWRAYTFVADSLSYDKVESEEVFCQAGHAFGRFMSMLGDFNAASLHETIARFHDTPKRFRDFHDAVDKDAAGRAEGVQDLIAKAFSYEAFSFTLVDMLTRGEIPLRVTHNDTKLNNVLIDEKTGRAVCVIDLDTVMPGLCAYDFGDAIRFGASTAAEDEQDLDKVHFDMNLFNAFAEGYLGEVGSSLSAAEIDSLAIGAKMMTLETGIRFLGDYLNGDTYFKTAYPEHNLVRARTQFKLLEEMEAHWEEMLACVRKQAQRNKPVLVIMAAGMGSRYGGLKQMDPVGPSGELILDYSLFDARRAGFERAVIIIKPENEKDFREVLGDRVSKHMKIDYAYQSLDRIPEAFEVPEGRMRPWGTGHAVLCAADLVGDAPFCAINADDYYGREAFRLCYDHLANIDDESDWCMVGYLLKNTLSETGSVSRGVCTMDENGNLKDLKERTHIIGSVDGPLYTEDGETYKRVNGESIVSMNMWGFSASMMQHLKEGFPAFLATAAKENPMKAEYFLPDAVDEELEAGKATARVYTTPDKWYGVTYREDRAEVVRAMKRMTEENKYPVPMWQK